MRSPNDCFMVHSWLSNEFREDRLANEISKRIAQFIEPLRVSPGSRVKLAKDFDPAFKAGIEKKKDGIALLNDGIELLADYQERLAAQDTHGVLVVLQALDAAGKDGTIRHVMSGLNPQGVRVESFKVPSARELDQDFLRRYQERLPVRGEIGIFNRSHYEEVLVVRVHPQNLLRQKLPSETRGHHVWKRRYEAINDWEQYLSDNGFRIVKLFLNLSREEQRVRFLRRIDLPDHNWKFSSHDVEERQYWDAYALRDLEAAKGRLEAEAPGAAAEPFERKEPEEPRSNSHVAHFTRAGAPAGKDD
jgi:PPK2 family polyphosphate:nucleotide phosphotransferase